MIVLVAVIGLVAGRLLSYAVTRQLASGHAASPVQEPKLGWVPLVSSLRARAWLSLAVELLTALMATVLYLRYGLSARSLVLFGASLVLINTGAVDFRIRMIDTLVLVIATVALVALAPVNRIGWLASGFGVAIAIALFLMLYLLAAILFRGVHAPFGLGDVFLGAYIGALVGFAALPSALIYGILMAGVVAFAILVLRAMGRQTPQYIAYGTYLCLGTLLFLATRSF